MYPIILSFILILMTTDTATATQFTVRELPYAYDALAPQVSEETLRFHHDKHYKGYVDKLNELLVDSPYAAARSKRSSSRPTARCSTMPRRRGTTNSTSTSWRPRRRPTPRAR